MQLQRSPPNGLGSPPLGLGSAPAGARDEVKNATARTVHVSAFVMKGNGFRTCGGCTIEFRDSCGSGGVAIEDSLSVENLYVL